MLMKLLSVLLVLVLLIGCNMTESASEPASEESVMSSITSQETTPSSADSSVPEPVKEYEPFDFATALNTLLDRDKAKYLLKWEEPDWTYMDWYEKLTQVFQFTLFDFSFLLIEDYEDTQQQIQNPKTVSGYNEKLPILFPNGSAIGAVAPDLDSVSMRPPRSVHTLAVYASDLAEEDRQLLAEDVFENFGVAPIIQHGERESFFEYRYNSLRFRFVLEKDSHIVNMVLIKRMVLYGDAEYEYDTNSQFEAVDNFSVLLGGDVSSLTHDTLKEWMSLPSTQLLNHLNMSGDDTLRRAIPLRPQSLYGYGNHHFPVNIPDIEGVYFDLSYAFESHFPNPERFVNTAYFTMDFAALNVEGFSMSMPLDQIMDKIGVHETYEMVMGDVSAVCVDYETEDFNFSFVAPSETEPLVYVVVSLH